jgi:hypothetical protein
LKQNRSSRFHKASCFTRTDIRFASNALDHFAENKNACMDMQAFSQVLAKLHQAVPSRQRILHQLDPARHAGHEPSVHQSRNMAATRSACSFGRSFIW